MLAKLTTGALIGFFTGLIAIAVIGPQTDDGTKLIMVICVAAGLLIERGVAFLASLGARAKATGPGNAE